MRRAQPNGVRESNDLARADSEQPLVAALTQFGLTYSESRVYLALLAMRAEKATRIASRARVARTKVYEVLQSLESHGFCHSEGHHGTVYRAVAPELVIPGWLEARDRRRRLEAAQDQELADRLIRELPSPGLAPPGDDGAQFEAVIGKARTSAVLPRLGRRAKRSLDIMQMPPFVQPRSAWNVVEAEAASRGVRVRIINNLEAMKERERVKEALQLGAEVRVVEALTMKMIIRDGEEAAIGVSDPSSGAATVTSVIFRQPEIVHGLLCMFDQAWNEARVVRLKNDSELLVDDAGEAVGAPRRARGTVSGGPTRA